MIARLLLLQEAQAFLVSELRTGLECQSVPFCLCLSRIRKWLHNRLAVKPIRELIGVVAATGLATLPAWDKHERFIPICRICHESHRRAVRFHSCARTVPCPGLRAVREAQEKFQSSFPADGMIHL